MSKELIQLQREAKQISQRIESAVKRANTENNGGERTAYVGLKNRQQKNIKGR